MPPSLLPPSLPFGKPLLDDQEYEAIGAVLKSGMLVHGKVTGAFEAAFAERAQVDHAVAVSSCTAGLHLMLFATQIGPGHKVAVPAMTHVATAHAVELVGAEPVFVDVEPDTGNIDPDGLEAVAGALSAAIVVHYLGLPCDMDRIGQCAAKGGFPVYEDCALAIDAAYDGRKAGGLAAGGSFSFYPVKHMTSIEGGMVTTNDATLAANIRQRRAFGYDRGLGARVKPGLYDVTALGFNYRMSEVEAAVGLAQLGKLDGFQARRAANARRLRACLADIEELTVFAPEKGKAVSSNYCINAILPKDGSIDRDVVAQALNAQGIGTSVHYPSAVPLFSYYREKYGYQCGQFETAEWIAAQTISLPVGPHLDEADMERIGDAMKSAIYSARHG